MMIGIPDPRWATVEGLKICPRCQYWGLDHEERCARCGRILIDHCVCGAPIVSPSAQKCFHCGEPLDRVQDIFEQWVKTQNLRKSQGDSPSGDK